MSCYFMVDVYIDENKGRGAYSDYIEKNPLWSLLAETILCDQRRSLHLVLRESPTG